MMRIKLNGLDSLQDFDVVKYTKKWIDGGHAATDNRVARDLTSMTIKRFFLRTQSFSVYQPLILLNIDKMFVTYFEKHSCFLALDPPPCHIPFAPSCN